MRHYRTYMAAPLDRLPALRAGIVARGIDPAGADWFVENLSADGSAPATHGWASWSDDDDGTLAWAGWLVEVVGGVLPADFSTMTPAQRMAFFNAAAPSIKAATGVFVMVVDNLKPWPVPKDVATAAGLKMVISPLP